MTIEHPQFQYDFSVDQISKNEWHIALNDFVDANFYQTWSYGELKWKMGNLSHLVLRKNGEIVALAQLRIVSLPIIGNGIAYLARGPMWKRRNTEPDFEIFRNVIKSLCKAYVVEKGLLLRILPNEFVDGHPMIHEILCQEGFVKITIHPERTLILDLTPPLEEIRQNLARRWRKALGKAEKSSLNLDCGNNEEYYMIALSIYKEMHNRKQFDEYVDMERQALIQKDLPEPYKIKIMICRLNDEPIAAIGWSTIGDTGLPLIGATSNKSVALSTNASNLLWWKMIEDMKAQGCKFCDLAGIDPEANPGGYMFKSGLLGEKNGRDVCFLAPYEACNNAISSFLVNFGEQIRLSLQKIKIRARRRAEDSKEVDKNEESDS